MAHIRLYVYIVIHINPFGAEEKYMNVVNKYLHVFSQF